MREDSASEGPGRGSPVEASRLTLGIAVNIGVLDIGGTEARCCSRIEPGPPAGVMGVVRAKAGIKVSSHLSQRVSL